MSRVKSVPATRFFPQNVPATITTGKRRVPSSAEARTAPRRWRERLEQETVTTTRRTTKKRTQRRTCVEGLRYTTARFSPSGAPGNEERDGAATSGFTGVRELSRLEVSPSVFYSLDLVLPQAHTTLERPSSSQQPVTRTYARVI